MKTATAHLVSNAPYGQSRFIDVPKLNDKESAAEYEERNWRERGHWGADGKMFIPPMAFKNCLSEAAGYLGEKIKGRGMATWKKHFEAGIMVFEPLVLPVKKENVPGLWMFVPSDGKKGGSKRVKKCFPVIQQWEGHVKFVILDSSITKDIFERHLTEAGNFIGIGWFRPIRGGYYGRFAVKSVSWS